MASKSGGGGFFWGVIGFLLGVSATLAALAWLSREPMMDADPRTAADDAAAVGLPSADPSGAAWPERPGRSEPLGPASGPAPEEPPAARRLAPVESPGLDPVTDDQIADDAAAAGMTTRAPPPD